MGAQWKALLAMARVIDSVIGEWSGRLFAWLVIPLMVGLAYEIVARYAFNAPTVWAYDLSYMLYGSHFMLGAAYTLYRRGHVRTDVFYSRFSPRVQGGIDAAFYLVFFLPGMIFIFLAGFQEARLSWSVWEVSDASPWRPPLYPFKTVIPLSAAMLLIQGVSEFLKSLYAAAKGEWPLRADLGGYEP